jgi:hypothetical protein
MIWVGIIAVVVVSTIAVKYDSSVKERKAVEVAKEYLAQKYEQGMICESVRVPSVDPVYYYVTFLSATTDVRFEVRIWPGIFKNQKLEDSDKNINDNYLSSFFCKKVAEIVLPEITAIWDDNASMQVTQPTTNVYPKNDAFPINEYMTEREMEPFYEYRFHITTNRLLNSESKAEEAQRIFNLFQAVQELNYHPVEIFVWYQTGKNEKDEISTDSETWAKRYIKFDAWEEIDSADQLVGLMNEQWTFED